MTQYVVKETWPNNPEYQELNHGWGNCKTDSGYKVVCSLGGIGCNVDHAFIKARNLEKILSSHALS